MQVLEVALLLMMLVLGGICAVQDLHRGIVPNRCIALGGIAACALQSISLICFSHDFALWWLINMLLGDALAVCMYAAGLWAAGDAKLFMLMYLCIPARLIEPYTLSCAVIPYCFIFVPAFFFILADSFIQALRRSERFDARSRFSLRDIKGFLAVMVEITAWQALSCAAFPSFWEENTFFASALMMVLAYACSGRAFLQRGFVIALHALSLGVMAVMGVWRFSAAPWWMVGVTLLCLAAGRWASGYNYRRIPTNQVREGMILSAGAVLSFRMSHVKELPQDPREDMKVRLTEAQAQAVRRWEKSKHGKDTVVILRKLPFAVLISAGFMGWILVRTGGLFI